MAKLLIVEDDPDTNNSIYEYLKGAGHQVHAAFDGKNQHYYLPGGPL